MIDLHVLLQEPGAVSVGRSLERSPRIPVTSLAVGFEEARGVVHRERAIHDGGAAI